MEGFDAYLSYIKGLRRLKGDARNVYVIIESNDYKEREDPAYYGLLHDKGRFPFSEPALEGVNRKIFNNPKVKEYFDNLTEMNKKRRTQDDMNRAAIIVAKICVEEVIDYILFDMPQKSQPWKKSGKRNLIETETLLNSIKGVVKKGGEEIWRGQ